jgi:dihydropyrimidine dehydrogenase (NAD+) subunit PreA
VTVIATPTTPYDSLYMTDAQLASELEKCEFCAEKPCREACPCDCSPTDFIRAARLGDPSDLRRAAAHIMSQNPLGGVCGLVCPDHHCMAACVHKLFDGAVDIPRVQAAIVERAKRAGVMPRFPEAPRSGRKVAVVGSGAAGLGAAALLARRGHAVTVLERGARVGGMCELIPDERLDKEALRTDIEWLLSLGAIELRTGTEVKDPAALLRKGGGGSGTGGPIGFTPMGGSPAGDPIGYDAVVVAVGLWVGIPLGIPGEALAIGSVALLSRPGALALAGKHVVIVGGGAVALDCAMAAKHAGATRVEMIALESPGEMPLTQKEMTSLLAGGIDLTGRTRVLEIRSSGDRVAGIVTERVRLPAGAAFHPRAVEAVPGTRAERPDVEAIVVAIGLRPPLARAAPHDRVFYAGDCDTGPTSVVEAAASGKNTAERVDAALRGAAVPAPAPRGKNGRVKSRGVVEGYRHVPVPLVTDFFGRTIPSPFLLSAAPPTDGLDQVKLAYEAGWAGAIMKTAFDGVPIHIPSEYMFAFDASTYANCDNVSGHPLERVCREVEELVSRYPDRLTIASTGGPVSGRDDEDAARWQSNTRKLEGAGAMAIEYSLSCPQGGDGTEGDIVSQNAALSAKIVSWILEAGSADVPKLFKLTGAVTSVGQVVAAIKAVMARHPSKKAGITLANSFPTLAFRRGERPGRRWEEGVVVGASGAGILPISYLSLAKVAHLGVAVSGNGGPMDHKAAAHFLALGARTVQFCTMAMKYGYGVIDDLCSGVSHLMAERGISSMHELIGFALPEPITDFMALPSKKKVSQASKELCLVCGNCTRCPYLAVTLDEKAGPLTDPSRCVGCGICALKCFAGAIAMRERTPEETAALREG